METSSCAQPRHAARWQHCLTMSLWKNSKYSQHITRMWTVPSCFSTDRATVPPHTGAGIHALSTRLCLDFRCARQTLGAVFPGVVCARLCVRECCYVSPRVAGNIAGLFIALPTLVPFLCQWLSSPHSHGGDQNHISHRRGGDSLSGQTVHFSR